MENPNSQYDPMFEAGIRAQLEEMIKNNHKTGWDDISLSWAVKKIKEHLPEMYRNVVSPAPIFDLVRLKKLASDIANLSHMIILQCDKRLNKDAENAN